MSCGIFSSTGFTSCRTPFSKMKVTRRNWCSLCIHQCSACFRCWQAFSSERQTNLARKLHGKGLEMRISTICYGWLAVWCPKWPTNETKFCNTYTLGELTYPLQRQPILSAQVSVYRICDRFRPTNRNKIPEADCCFTFHPSISERRKAPMFFSKVLTVWIFEQIALCILEISVKLNP